MDDRSISWTRELADFSAPLVMTCAKIGIRGEEEQMTSTKKRRKKERKKERGVKKRKEKRCRGGGVIFHNPGKVGACVMGGFVGGVRGCSCRFGG